MPRSTGKKTATRPASIEPSSALVSEHANDRKIEATAARDTVLSAYAARARNDVPQTTSDRHPIRIGSDRSLNRKAVRPEVLGVWMGTAHPERASRLLRLPVKI